MPEIPNPVSPGTKELSIGHLKVDWEHQSRGVGGLLILSHSGNVFGLSVIPRSKNGKASVRKSYDNLANVGTSS